jgi:hypothetical protein
MRGDTGSTGGVVRPPEVDLAGKRAFFSAYEDDKESRGELYFSALLLKSLCKKLTMLYKDNANYGYTLGRTVASLGASDSLVSYL